MPVSHRKSRFGCSACRKRKVKCDEGRPRCGACVRRHATCTYNRHSSHDEAIEAQAGAQITVSSANSNAYPSPSTSSITPTDDKQSLYSPLDLHLYHHYLAYTCEIFTFAVEAYRVRVPLVAMSDRPLFDCILALSALHISRMAVRPLGVEMDTSLLRTYTDSDLRNISAGFFERSLPAHRQLIAQVSSEQEYQRAFCGSVVIGLYCLCMIGEPRLPSDVAPERLWFHLGAGRREIGGAWGQMTRERTGRQVFYDWGFMTPEINLVHDPEFEKLGNASPLLPLLDMAKNYEIVDAEDEAAYTEALIYVAYICNRCINNEDTSQGTCSRLTALSARVSPRYRENILQQKPCALAIAAYAFAVTKLLEQDIELLRGVAECGVRSIHERLPPAWKTAIRWPLQVLDFDPLLDPERPALFF